MKNLFLTALFFIFTTTAWADLKVGANGFPMGWAQEYQTRWNKAKNDPSPEIQKHWNKLDPEFKYMVTQDPQYVPGDILQSTVWASWNNEFRPFCGTRPYYAVGQVNSNVVAVQFGGNDIDAVLNLLKVGNKVKVTYNGFTQDWTVQNRVDKVIVSGNTFGGFFYLGDNNVDFVAAGVKYGDLVRKVSTGQLFDITSVSQHQVGLEGTKAGERNFAGGDQYEIIRPTFQLQEGENFLFFREEKSLTFQPHDKIFYHPENCDAQVNKDKIREAFGKGVIKYGAYYNVITQDQKLILNDVFTNLSYRLLGSVTPDDYDNYNLAYVVITQFIELVKADFPEIHRQISENSTYKSLKAGVGYYLQDVMGGEPPDTMAETLNGTNYDPGTFFWIAQGLDRIEGFTGRDDFPSLDQKSQGFGESLKAFFLPTFRGHFQWSDDQHPYFLDPYIMYDVVAFWADRNKDPELYYLWDKLTQIGQRPFTSPFAFYSPSNDPYAPRVTEAQWLSKKNLHYNDRKRGISFMHSSRDPKNASIHYTNLWGSPGTDHNPNGSDFGLVRCHDNQCEQMSDFARSYYGVLFHTGLNEVIPFNAYGIYNPRVQKDYQHGENWKYTKGTKRNVTQGDPNFVYSLYGGAGNVVEQTREQLSYHFKTNGTDLIILKDTLQTPSGQDGVRTRTTRSGVTFDDVPNNIQGVEQFQDDSLQRMKVARYRHQIQFGIPTITPDVGENSWTWKGNLVGQNLEYVPGTQINTLTTFVKDYSWGAYDPAQNGPGSYPWFDGGTINPAYGVASSKFLRIVPEKDQFGRFSWFNALYARGPNDEMVTYTQTEKGLIAKVGSETVEVSFDPFILKVNGTVQESVVPPTPSEADPIPPAPVPTPEPQPTPNPIPTPQPSLSQPPRGMFDGVEGSIIYGWSYDPDNTSLSNQIQVLIDGQHVGTITTNSMREDVNNAFGLTGEHGYSFTIPNGFKDGLEHSIVVKALDLVDGQVYQVGSSGAPMTFKIAPPIPEPTPEPDKCDFTHFALCTTRIDCFAAGWYWYNDKCNNVPEPQPIPTPEPTPSAADIIIDIKSADVVKVTRRKKANKQVLVTVDPALKVTVNNAVR